MIKLLAFLRRDAHADIDTLSAQVDGRLDRARAAALEAHLASCEACDRRIGELRAVRAALSALPVAEPARSFRIHQSAVAAAARRGPDGPGQALRLMPAMSAAAVVLFAALVGVDVLSGRDGRSVQTGTSAGGFAAAERSKDTLAAPAGPQTIAADQAAGDEAPAPGGRADGIEPSQVAGEGTFPAAVTSDSEAASPAGAEEPPPTGESYSDGRAEGGSGGESRTGLRIAEAIVAAVAAGAGAAAAFGWQRRRGVRR